MNSFSINRFGRTLRWVVGVNFRKLLMWTSGVAMAVFAGELILMKIDHSDYPHRQIEGFALLGWLIFIFASLILTSSIVSCIHEKRKREAFLMLPASSLEKYLSLLLYTTVISIACIFLAIVMGDSLRMLCVWVSGYADDIVNPYVVDNAGNQIHWWSSAVSRMWYGLTQNFDSSGHSFIYNEGHSKSVELLTNGYIVAQYALFLAFVMWTHSLFLAGGTFLRKYAFVISGIVFILIIWLFAQTIKTFPWGLYDYKCFVEYGREGFDYYETAVRMVNSSIAGIVLVLLLAFSCFNYWASYHIFKGFQLISNKWTNYDILKR